MRLLEFCKVSEYYIRTLPKAERDRILKTPDPESQFKSPTAQERYKNCAVTQTEMQFKVPSPVIPEIGGEERILNETLTLTQMHDEMEVEHTSEPAPESAYESAEEPMSSIDQTSEPSVMMPISPAKDDPIYEDISDPEDEPELEQLEKELRRRDLDSKQEMSQKDKFSNHGENFDYNDELSDHESLADGPLGVDFPPPSPEPKPFIDRNLILPPRGFPHPLMHSSKALGFEPPRDHPRFMLNPFWHQSPFQKPLSREEPGAHQAERQANVPHHSVFRHPVTSVPIEYSHSLYPQFPVFTGMRNELPNQQVQAPRPRQPYPSHNQQPPPHHQQQQHQRMPPPFHMLVPPPAIPPVYYPYALYPPREFAPYQQGQNYAAPQTYGAQQNSLQNQNFQQQQNRNQYRSKQPENASNYRPPCFNHNTFTQ